MFLNVINFEKRYLVLLYILYVTLPAKMLLTIDTVWTLSKLSASLMKNNFLKRPSGAHLHMLSKLIPVRFVIPPYLRQCISLFVVAEGWLLFDIE